MHVPVLIKEVLHYLDPHQNENFIDATVGEGGHAIEILKKNGPNGRVLGIDLDKEQIKNANDRFKQFGERIILKNDSYANLKEVAEKIGLDSVNGILLDLGMSSWHLEKSGRGFSFMKNEPLSMNFGEKSDLTAEKIVNEWPESEMERIFKKYGEEKFSKKIAKKIAEKRKIKKISASIELVDIIKESLPVKFQGGRIHFATRVFQALRIAVNKEIDNLNQVLPKAIETLSNGGKLVVISFHSLEDRIVKIFFKEMSALGKATILTKKPIIAGPEEILNNPRARSAKLRAIVKL
jgi:16S rRNA (cytosine1402-N4)-methyltransferase